MFKSPCKARDTLSDLKYDCLAVKGKDAALEQECSQIAHKLAQAKEECLRANLKLFKATDDLSKGEASLSITVEKAVR